MSEPIISVSGLRGIVGESLTPEVVVRYVGAFSGTLRPGRVVISFDGRTSGPMLADIVRGTLTACGRDVVDAGIAATPTVGILVETNSAAGGVQISASHNPAPYNGIKLFSQDGRVLRAAEGHNVLQAYRVLAPDWKAYDRVGKIMPAMDTLVDHLRLVLGTIDCDRVVRHKYKVLLDSNAGAGSVLGRSLLGNLDCDVTILGDQPNGQFKHPPEPTEANLVTVCDRVRQENVDVGFCQDPDADRLAIIDENGRYIGEEYTLAICLDHVLRQRPGPIVTNCATSRMAEDIAAKYGVPFFRSAVGEANVVDKMLEVGAVFGGEGNGGPIDPRVGLVRDSFVGMALVLDAMASRGKKVSELAVELPRYEIIKRTVSLAADRLPAAFDAVQRHFADAKPDRLDGLRLDWPDRWLIVRGSNTEPIVRVIAEAPTAAAAEELVKSASSAIAVI